MKLTCVFGLGVGVGLLLAVFQGNFTASALGGAGQGGVASANGDVNGDGQINLTDAIHLLNWLFKGGAEPEAIDCDQPPPSTARFRFLNVLVCGQTPFPARLDVCGATATDTFDDSDTATPCREISSADSCSVRCVANTADCGAFEVCGAIRAEENHVYDVVLSVLSDGTPALGIFDQMLNAAGDCPPFPSADLPPTIVISTPCGPAAAGAAAGGGGGWRAAR